MQPRLQGQVSTEQTVAGSVNAQSVQLFTLPYPQDKRKGIARKVVGSLGRKS